MVVPQMIEPSLAPQPGRVARKRQAIRARLLAAGFAQAGQKGLDGIVISDLTEAADCAKGAFYLHFESREAFCCRIDQSGTGASGSSAGCLWQDTTG